MLVRGRRHAAAPVVAVLEAGAADLAAQAQPEADSAGLLARYPKAVVSDFDGDPAVVSEMDALVAYLQMLGTLVDFTTWRPEYAEAPVE